MRRWTWCWLLVPPCLFVLMAFAGCTTAKPPVWLLYADSKQAWGRLQVQFEQLCDPPNEQTVRICTEAMQQNNALLLLEPSVRAELSKERPDWATIMQWVQIAVGIASKFVPLAVGPLPPKHFAPPPAPAPTIPKSVAPLSAVPDPERWVTFLVPPEVGVVYYSFTAWHLSDR